MPIPVVKLVGVVDPRELLVTVLTTLISRSAGAARMPAGGGGSGVPTSWGAARSERWRRSMARW